MEVSYKAQADADTIISVGEVGVQSELSEFGVIDKFSETAEKMNKLSSTMDEHAEKLNSIEIEIDYHLSPAVMHLEEANNVLTKDVSDLQDRVKLAFILSSIIGAAVLAVAVSIMLHLT